MLVLLALGGMAVAAPEPAVVQEWSFEKGVQDWAGINTTPLEVREGALVFEVTGKDVQLISPTFDLKPQVGDCLEIRIKSTTEGTAEWFWRATTEGPYGGFSGEMRRQVHIAAGDDWQVLHSQPLWQECERIITVRFDPPEGLPGTYAVASVRVLRFGEGEPVAARFDFAAGGEGAGSAAGDRGWTAPAGDVAAVEEGLRVTLPTAEARVMSPPLTLDAEGSPYVVLEATAPASPAWDGRVPAALEFTAGQTGKVYSRPFWLAAGRRGTYNLRMAGVPGWEGPVGRLLLRLTHGLPSELTLHAVRAAGGPESPDLAAGATGLEFQTGQWRREWRLPSAPRRTDLTAERPPETHPVESDYTVAMWYFAAWEPEYTWDGWKQVGERSPWRLPLLYDPSDEAMRFNGIQFYRSSDPRAVDWHVHWMREHAINLMLWDWYPMLGEDGAFKPDFFGNRALEVGFLGKSELGGPAVETNRFVGKMDFAVMWTNHGPHDRIGRGLVEYLVEHFFSQPNYYRVDGKPLLVVWSVPDLVKQAGGEDKAREVLEELRALAGEQGHAGVYVAAVNGAQAELLRRIGIDGVTGYHYAASGGHRVESRQIGDRTVQDLIEDYPTQSIPGHVSTWSGLADTYGRDYLLATSPMQNWEPTFRGTNIVMQNHSPDAYREMLSRAKAFIEERGLRRFVAIEAWNEWLEGSYMEPSTQWGLSYLEAVRDMLGKPAGEQ